MIEILIDTDVILDFFFDRKPFATEAAKVLSLCEKKELKGFVTPVIISNTYYLLRQTARHEKVIEQLKKLLLIVDVLAMDREIVMNALNSEFADFEDAMQNFAAIKSKSVSIIITRNTKDYRKSTLSAMTPTAFLSAKS